MDRTLVVEDFVDKVGQRFVIATDEDGGEPVAATLTEAQPLLGRGGFADRTRPAFSLVFVSDHPVMLPQRIYSVQHEALGVVAIFLVPIGRDARGFSYQATFN